jgi:hypothetical protein
MSVSKEELTERIKQIVPFRFAAGAKILAVELLEDFDITPRRCPDCGQHDPAHKPGEC